MDGAGRRRGAAYNTQQLRAFEDPLGFGEYLVAPDFWNRTLQNWQSESRAVLSMALLSIYLRQRGSPECKAVGGRHSATGVGG